MLGRFCVRAKPLGVHLQASLPLCERFVCVASCHALCAHFQASLPLCERFVCVASCHALCAHFQASLPLCERSVAHLPDALWAFTFRHPCLTRLCGFSHPHSSTKKRRPHPLGTVSLKISTIAEGTSRCVASLHAPKVRFMCRKAHLVLKPAGCQIMNALLALHPCKALGRS